MREKAVGARVAWLREDGLQIHGWVVPSHGSKGAVRVRWRRARVRRRPWAPRSKSSFDAKPRQRWVSLAPRVSSLKRRHPLLAQR